MMTLFEFYDEFAIYPEGPKSLRHAGAFTFPAKNTANIISRLKQNQIHYLLIKNDYYIFFDDAVAKMFMPLPLKGSNNSEISITIFDDIDHFRYHLKSFLRIYYKETYKLKEIEIECHSFLGNVDFTYLISYQEACIVTVHLLEFLENHSPGSLAGKV